MKSSLTVLIEKDAFGYAASCSEIEGYKVTAKSLDIVVNSIKTTIQDYLEGDFIEESNHKNKPIWEIAKELIEDLTDEEKQLLPSDGAKQHDYYIYGTQKIN
jgi:predicted RNase H-like HicB family nuclease